MSFVCIEGISRSGVVTKRNPNRAKPIHGAIARALSAALLCLSNMGAVSAAEPAANDLSRFNPVIETAPVASPGQSRTLLPDGRWLLIGGNTAETRASITAKAYALATGSEKSSLVSAKLMYPRAGHTATVLPDGTVLILGGVDASGSPVSPVEIFDPITGEITVVQDSALTARSQHTATLLTDGLVLITGGISANGKPLQDAQLWNPESQRIEPLSNAMLVPRARHSAALLADGKDLIWGGQAGSGQELADGEILAPAS